MALPEKCPLCGSDITKQNVVTTHVFGDADGGRAFYHCEVCDVRYQHPSLSQEEEARFYAAEFESFMASRSGEEGGWHNAEKHIIANEKTRIRRMKYLAPHLPKQSDILEIGCSSGFMLIPLVEERHECVGIEPSGVFSEYLNHRGINVYGSIDQFKDAEPDSRFDVILHFFVLEHISDPIAFLKLQLALLKPGGKIVFEIPNVADPLHSVYDIQAFERFYWSIAHPWYFSERSLGYILNEVGCPYEVQGGQRYDLSNHIVWARDGRPGGMERFTEQLGEDLENAYKNALIKVGKCDTLIGVITKVHE